MPAISPTIERALADVFNHQYQSFPADTPWITVMRSVARAIAATIYPESAELRASFLDDANMAGLFAGETVPDLSIGDQVTVYSPDSRENVNGAIYHLTDTYVCVETSTGRMVGGPISELKPSRSATIPPIYAPPISEEVMTTAQRIAAELLASNPTYSHPRADSTPALYRVVRATMGRAPVAIIDGSAPYPLDDESISEGIVRALNARQTELDHNAETSS